ncbi:MAG: transaldolase family protein [Chloroflexota bacterium]
MADETATDIWNDSCAEAELRWAMERGAVGATSNPSLVLDALRQEPQAWRAWLLETASAHPHAAEDELAWRLAEALAIRGASMLEPVFEAAGRRRGRLSIQVDPARYADADAMLAQAERFAALGPNLQVKLPTTAAGLDAMEAATARGIHINATVNFTVPGALAVAEAVERGLDRLAAAEGEAAAAAMTPVCTLMVGRLEDWLRVIAAREGILPTPGRIEWAGIAVAKRAIELYRERGYRTRILVGAFRTHLPWTELAGADIVLTIPPGWQRLIDDAGLHAGDRAGVPVDPAVVDELLDRFPDFRRAYEPDGLATSELVAYGAAARTLRQFIGASHDLQAHVRDVCLPDPDRRSA